MRNCIILGSGRSGTSMLAGVLAKSGYFMGDNLYPGRESNPNGFFEDPEINGINEQILAPFSSGNPFISGNWSFRHQPDKYGQRWLISLPNNIKIQSTQEVEKRIEKLVSREPYCFKDPRFSYTLPIWKPYLRNTVYFCIFREPSLTASSILKEISIMPYLDTLRTWFTFENALEVWYRMYSNIISNHARNGDWFFFHYNQILRGNSWDTIEKNLEVTIDRSFPDSKLNHSNNKLETSSKYLSLYEDLCKLANFEDNP